MVATSKLRSGFDVKKKEHGFSINMRYLHDLTLLNQITGECQRLNRTAKIIMEDNYHGSALPVTARPEKRETHQRDGIGCKFDLVSAVH